MVKKKKNFTSFGLDVVICLFITCEMITKAYKTVCSKSCMSALWPSSSPLLIVEVASFWVGRDGAPYCCGFWWTALGSAEPVARF